MCEYVLGLCGLLLEIAKIVIALVGLFLTLRQITVAIKQHKTGLDAQRAQTLKELYDEARKDDNIAKIVSIIDWDCGKGKDCILSYNSTKGKFALKPTSEFGEIDAGELERKIDRTLALFNHVCYLFSLKVLFKEDMKMFEYRLQRIADNEAVSCYLQTLKGVADKLGVAMSFDCLFKYLEDNCWK